MNKLKEGEAKLEKTAKTIESASKQHPLQAAFWLGLVAIPAVVVALAPFLHIKEGGWLSLTRMQLGYAMISLDLAMVIYAYGVGNWSRFEPPKLRSMGWGAGVKNPPDTKRDGTSAISADAPPKTQGGQ